MSDTPENLHPEEAEPVGGTAAEWVDEAAKRAEHTAEKPMSWFAYPATYTLVLINVVVFLLAMHNTQLGGYWHHHVWSQMFTAQFDVDHLIAFGASDAELVVRSGQWWRLLTATFVHVTVLHIVINLWCLWNLGLFGEPLLGKPGLVSVYLLTGVAGNMLSVTWCVLARRDGVVAGASGAVFGIAGILIVLLSNRGLVKPDLSWKEIRGLRTQVILFAVVNLLLAALPPYLPSSWLVKVHIDPAKIPHVDNTAHLGGCVFGLLLGIALFKYMTTGKKPYRARQRIVFAVATLLLCLYGYALTNFA